MKVKISKMKHFMYASDEMTIIKLAYKKAKGGKLKKAKNLLEDIGAEELVERFIKYPIPNQVDLNMVEKLIIVCKILYANGKTIMSDKIYDPMVNRFKMFREEPIADLIMSKRLVDTGHEYPELKGNIAKANVFDEASKRKSLDRSVEAFAKYIFSYSNGKKLRFLLSLKYDGVSGIASVKKNGKIRLLLSRGENDKGADLTHLSKHIDYGNIGEDCGVKYEMVITEENKKKYEKDRHKKFDNLRTTVISIISSSDGAKYSKYLSFVPLQASNITPGDYETLNERFAQDVEFICREVEVKNAKDLVKEVMEFAKVVQEERYNLPFDIDGIVIDCVDKDVRETVGRKDNINNYQIAYKFPPMAKLTQVKSVSITVGRTGLVTPMVHYSPITFNGATHDKSTLSSFERFKAMNLRYDEEILVTYNNDVMPYPQKYDSEYNRNLRTKFIQFPKRCVCGGELTLEGANYFCHNPNCKGKIVSQYTWFYKTLGVKNFGEANVQKFLENGIISSYEDLLELDYNAIGQLEGYGNKSVKSLKKQIDFIYNNPIDEAKLCTALGLGGDKTCKQILSIVPLETLMKEPNKLYSIKIDGIEDLKKKTFLVRLMTNLYAIKHLCEVLTIIPVKVSDNTIKICFSGFRDAKMKALLESLGVEVVDNVNKHTNYVVTKSPDIETSKTKKAKKFGIRVIGMGELLDIMKTIE